MPTTDPVPPVRPPRGGGAPFVLALIGGLAVGLAFRQPTIGFLGGAALGIAITALLWWRDRR